jgi:hypothetical protein
VNQKNVVDRGAGDPGAGERIAAAESARLKTPASARLVRHGLVVR